MLYHMHVFEVQMLKDHLRKNNIQFKYVFILLRHCLIIFLSSQMDDKLKDKVKKILNGLRNIELIPASINQSVRFLSCWQNILHMIHFISERPVD